MINQGYITILKVFRLAPLSRRCGKITRRGIAEGFTKHGDKIARRGIAQRFRDLQHRFTFSQLDPAGDGAPGTGLRRAERLEFAAGAGGLPRSVEYTLRYRHQRRAAGAGSACGRLG